MDLSASGPDISEWIASVVLSIAIPTTYFVMSLVKMGSRLNMLEYRLKQLERKQSVHGNKNDDGNNSDKDPKQSW